MRKQYGLNIEQLSTKGNVSTSQVVFSYYLYYSRKWQANREARVALEMLKAKPEFKGASLVAVVYPVFR